MGQYFLVGGGMVPDVEREGASAVAAAKESHDNVG